MRLHSITLQNFRDFKDVSFDLSGQDVSIYGDNETGKTTLANAYSYLLTDKPYTGEPGFTPKSIRGDTHAHNLNHIVSAIFETSDGQMIKLTKDYHEIWTKKRGNTAEEMTGHTIDYYVDDVPVKAGDFQAVVKQLFGDPDSIQILSVPTYFSDVLSWQQRRELLLSICGDVSDQEVINAYPELLELPLYLAKGTSGTYTIEELKAKTEASRRKMNQDLVTIPPRIDEAEKAIPDVKGSRPMLEKKLTQYHKKLDELKALQVASTTDDAKRTQWLIAKQDLERRSEQAAYTYNDKHKLTIRTKIDEAETLRVNVNRMASDRTQLERDISHLMDHREKLLEGRKEIMELLKDEHTKQYHGDTICPTCSQNLPADQIAAATAKFNEAKAKRMEALNEKGRTQFHKSIVEKAEQEIAELQERYTNICEQLIIAEKSYQTARTAIETAKEDITPWELTDECKALQAEAEAIQTVYNESYLEQPEDTRYDSDIKEIESFITDTQHLISQLTTKENQEKRIAELEAKEKELAKAVEQQDLILHLCETFTRKKADFLSENINNRFESVRFRLFKDQINGGLKDDCEVLVPSEAGNLVPYTSANNAGRINAGIEIINAIATAWQSTLPIVIDNAESVTRYKPTESQLIKLVVSAQDAELRLETN